MGRRWAGDANWTAADPVPLSVVHAARVVQSNVVRAIRDNAVLFFFFFFCLLGEEEEEEE